MADYRDLLGLNGYVSIMMYICKSYIRDLTFHWESNSSIQSCIRLSRQRRKKPTYSDQNKIAFYRYFGWKMVMDLIWSISPIRIFVDLTCHWESNGLKSLCDS